MTTNRPLDSGRKDALGRTIRVAANAGQGRASAPPPLTGGSPDFLASMGVQPPTPNAATVDEAASALAERGLSVEQMATVTGSGRRNIDGCENSDTVLNKFRAGALSVTGVMGAVFGVDSPEHHRGFAGAERKVDVPKRNVAGHDGSAWEHYHDLRAEGMDHSDAVLVVEDHPAFADVDVDQLDRYHDLRSDGLDADDAEFALLEDGDEAGSRDFSGDNWRDLLGRGDEVRVGSDAGDDSKVGVVMLVRTNPRGERMFHVAVDGDNRVLRDEDIH